MDENKHSSLVLLGIVSLVAIVGLITMMQSSKVVVTNNPSSGAAYASPQPGPVAIGGGHYVYEGNFTPNSTTKTLVEDCNYFWDNYDAFHEGGVNYALVVTYYNYSNSSNSSNSTNSSYEALEWYKKYDVCLSGSTLKEYSCEYYDNTNSSYLVETVGECSEGCFTEGNHSYCKKSKVWVGGTPAILTRKYANQQQLATQ